MEPIASQFTEEIYATQAAVCERVSCSKHIHVGDRRHYVGNLSGSMGKWVCGNCYDRYAQGPSTVIRLYPSTFKKC
jgi:hypothetical protein